MFGRIQSGLFGRRERSIAPAPPVQQRPPSPFRLPLGPPGPERQLPLHGQWIGELQGPQYVAPYHNRYYPRGRQIAQARENISAVRRAFPPVVDAVIYNPGDDIPVIGNEEKSNEERNARRVYNKIRAQRYGKGGSIKSYGVGSSSIKDVIISSRGGGGGKEPPKPIRNVRDIQNEISDIDMELRRLNREKKRLRESNDPGDPALIRQIDDTIAILSKRKIEVMRGLR